MRKDWVLTQDSFDNLLEWLGSDREQAGKRYEEIRSRLIRIFARRGCTTSEELADETINRVINKIQDLKEKYEGDPAIYFYGVAQKIYLENLKKNPTPTLSQSPDPLGNIQEEYECLERCLQALSAANRELILQYYEEDKQSRIDLRKDLAERLEITQHTLRMRAHRIKVALKKCVLNCLNQDTK